MANSEEIKKNIQDFKSKFNRKSDENFGKDSGKDSDKVVGCAKFSIRRPTKILVEICRQRQKNELNNISSVGGVEVFCKDCSNSDINKSEKKEKKEELVIAKKTKMCPECGESKLMEKFSTLGAKYCKACRSKITRENKGKRVEGLQVDKVNKETNLSKKVCIVFDNYPDLFIAMEEKAKIEFRTIDQQILFEIYKIVGKDGDNVVV